MICIVEGNVFRADLCHQSHGFVSKNADVLMLAAYRRFISHLEEKKRGFFFCVLWRLQRLQTVVELENFAASHEYLTSIKRGT